MRHFLTLACVLVCFCVCGTLSAQAPKKKPAQSAPAAKKHHATPVKHKPATKPRNNRAKAVAKDNSQVNAKKQIAKMAVVKDTVIVDETAGTVLVTPGPHHEPQAVSDAQLRQAQRLLLTLPATLEKLQQAHALLLRANWNYDGHRARAQEAVEYAISEFPTDPDEAAIHIKKAARELDIALQVN